MSNLENILSNSDCLSQEQILLYLENKLEKEAAHATESHLIDCAFCSDALEGLQLSTTEENNASVKSIQSDIEALLFADEKKNATATTVSKTEKITKTVTDSSTKLTGQKGGRRISWVAAAGLFFLIFSGGLAVFSYVRNNTDFFSPKEEAYSKNSDTKNFEPEELPSIQSSPEYGGVTITTESNGDKKIDKASPKGKREINKKIDNTKDYAVAKNELSEDTEVKTIEKSANPTVASAPSPSAPRKKISSEQESIVDRMAVVKEEKLNSKIDDLSKQNTYTQPKYKGKASEIQEIGSVNSKQKSKKVSSKSRYARKDQLGDEARRKEIIVSNSSQTKGLRNKKAIARDNAFLANQAFQKGDYKQSIKYYKRALQANDLTNRTEVMYQLALAYEKTNSLRKAEKIYEDLEKIGSYNSRANSGLQRVRRARGK